MQPRWSLLLLLVLASCSATRPYVAPGLRTAALPVPPPDSALDYRVFLIGNAGETPLDPPAPALVYLKTRLAGVSDRSAVVFLGDNLHPRGLPDSSAAARSRAEGRLRAQLETLRGFPGRVVFLPGEHDWNDGRPAGLETLARQEAFVEAGLGRGNVFLPDDGFPGPVEVPLTDRLTLIALDTQWWITDEQKSFGDTGAYDLDSKADFLLALDQLVEENRDRNLLVVGHHPMVSNGKRGGHFPPWAFLFPPYPVFRHYFGAPQDLAHPSYRTLRRALRPIFARHDGLVYAAAHEHSLQYFRATGRNVDGPTRQHYLVSGAGSDHNFVARGRGAGFAYDGEGFLELAYYADGSVWLEAHAPEGDGRTGRTVFRTRIEDPDPENVDPGLPDPATVDVPDYRDSTVAVAAEPGYAAGAVKAFLLGRDYRPAWATPVEVPVLDLGREAGGLTPVRIGGGSQTLSLRLRGPGGKEYVLRSVEKDPARRLPEYLRGTIAQDFARDRYASLHPYAALIVPRLSEAAGVYHTNPKPVFVPDDPRLGVFRERFAGALMLLEERPDDDWSDQPSFGRSEDILSTHRLLLEVNADNDHRVDQRAFVRSRLVDMLVADWDRGRDQWRWASFEPYEIYPSLGGEARTAGKIYRPIPRDRDFAFSHNDGLIPALTQFAELRPRDFGHEFGTLKGLTKEALDLDRRFTSMLTRQEWIEIARSVRDGLTDQVIEEAVRAWPEPLFALNGPDVIEKLKARRDQLPAVAENLYLLHARVVDIVGSNKHERFEVRRVDDDLTEVVVFSTTKEGETRGEIYRRIFFHDETREIRLYGLGGHDRFEVTGDVDRGPRIRAVGGPGPDAFVDRSQVTGPGRRTRFYDSAAGNTWETGPETHATRSDAPIVNVYDPFDYKHNAWVPVVYTGSNKEDGVLLGGGVRFTEHGFRKRPYARSHVLQGRLSTNTRGFNLVYVGRIVSAFGPWDLDLDGGYFSPDNVRNYFGIGNETPRDQTAGEPFYWARLSSVRLASGLSIEFEEGARIRFGPRVEFNRVRRQADRFVTRREAGVPDEVFGGQYHIGLDAGVELENVDDALNPRQGYRIDGKAEVNLGLKNAPENFTRLASSVSVYASPSLRPQVTLALRAGGAHVLGAFPFYAASSLGGKEALRGYPSNRFDGRTSFYQNVELRAELFRFAVYLANGTAGALGFLDNGRVWADGEASGMWHQGAGVGLWANAFDRFVATALLGRSREETRFSIKLGFLY